MDTLLIIVMSFMNSIHDESIHKNDEENTSKLCKQMKSLTKEIKKNTQLMNGLLIGRQYNANLLSINDDIENQNKNQNHDWLSTDDNDEHTELKEQIKSNNNDKILCYLTKHDIHVGICRIVFTVLTILMIILIGLLVYVSLLYFT